MMKKDYLTIKEFANEIGMSQQGVYKQLNKKLKPYLKIIENKKMLDKSALSLFKKQEKTNQDEQPLNSKLIDMLEKQLEEKDKQIAELQKLLDQEQKLHAMSRQKLDMLEDKTPAEEPKRKWWQIKKATQ